MRLPNLARWLRTRNAAIGSRRVDHAARTKGGLFAKDQTPDWIDVVLDNRDAKFVPDEPMVLTLDNSDGYPRPDDLMAVADEVAETLMPPGCIWPSCTLDKACTPDEAACEPQPTYREQLIGEDIDIWDDSRQKRRADR